MTTTRTSSGKDGSDPKLHSLEQLQSAISLICRRSCNRSVPTDTQREAVLDQELKESGAAKRLLGTATKNWGRSGRPLVEILDDWISGADVSIIQRKIANAAESIRLLRVMIEAWHGLEKASTDVPVRLSTTALLSVRLWPEVRRQLERMAKKDPGTSGFLRDIDVEITSDFEPNRLVQDIAEVGTWDIAIAYGKKSVVDDLSIDGDRRTIIDMHRCLLCPVGTLSAIPNHRKHDQIQDRDDAVRVLEQLLKRRQLAVLTSYEDIFGNDLASLLADAGIKESDLIRRPTTLELHGLVRAGRACCLTTLEAQGQNDARMLDCYRLNQEFGRSSMIVVRKKWDDFDWCRPNNDPNRPLALTPQADRIDKVYAGIRQSLEDYDKRYQDAARFEQTLVGFRHCYISASTKLEAKIHPPEDTDQVARWGLHFWRGEIPESSIQVQATLDTGGVRKMLCVSADYELFGATSLQIKEHDLPSSVDKQLSFHLLGRLAALDKDDQTWQLSLRGAADNEEDGDVFVAYLMLRVEKTNGANFAIQGFSDFADASTSVLVGHWLGQIDFETKPVVPDGGLFVLSQRELTADELNQIAAKRPAGFSLTLRPTNDGKQAITLIGERPN